MRSKGKKQLAILKDCKKLLVQAISNPVPEKPFIQPLNVDFIIDFISIVHDYEEASEILRNGARIELSEKEIWKGALTFKNDHSCFLASESPFSFVILVTLTLTNCKNRLFSPRQWT